MWGPLGHLQSHLPWESHSWDLCLRGQSFLQFFSNVVLFRLDRELRVALILEGNPAWGVPPSHSNNKSISFHLSSSRHLSSGCFRADLITIVVALVFCQVLFSSYFPLHILYHNIPSEPAATVLKTDLVQTPIVITYSRYLELTEWEIYFLRVLLLLNFWYQCQ